jgi:hypothetical protein
MPDGDLMLSIDALHILPFQFRNSVIIADSDGSWGEMVSWVRQLAFSIDVPLFFAV